MAGEARNVPVAESTRERQPTMTIPLDNPDQLLAAVANATADMNIFNNVPNVTTPQNASTDAQSNPHDDSYGIYTKVCKVAKKTGDPFIVFAVLGLIVRDPSYGAEGSDTEVFCNQYKPPSIKIEWDRVRRILPMLFLAKFDPNSSIREIMRKLWSILIPFDQESALLSAHSDEIIAELTSNLKSRQWKDRESACLALESLIPQRPWKRLRPSLPTLWEYGMDVLDDIRDSTRVAALGYMKTLANQVFPYSVRS